MYIIVPSNVIIITEDNLHFIELLNNNKNIICLDFTVAYCILMKEQ